MRERREKERKKDKTNEWSCNECESEREKKGDIEWKKREMSDKPTKRTKYGIVTVSSATDAVVVAVKCSQSMKNTK